MSVHPVLRRLVRATGWVVAVWIFVACVITGSAVMRWVFGLPMMVSLLAGAALGVINLVALRFLPQGRSETVGESVAAELLGE